MQNNETTASLKTLRVLCLRNLSQIIGLRVVSQCPMMCQPEGKDCVKDAGRVKDAVLALGLAHHRALTDHTQPDDLGQVPILTRLT